MLPMQAVCYSRWQSVNYYGPFAACGRPSFHPRAFRQGASAGIYANVRTVDVRTTIAVQQVVGNPHVTTVSMALSVTAARRACGPPAPGHRAIAMLVGALAHQMSFNLVALPAAPTPSRQSRTSDMLPIPKGKGLLGSAPQPSPGLPEGPARPIGYFGPHSRRGPSPAHRRDRHGCAPRATYRPAPHRLFHPGGYWSNPGW